MQPNHWARFGQKGALIFAPLVVLPLLLVFVSVASATIRNGHLAWGLSTSLVPMADADNTLALLS
jgi:hypothetical protein